MSLRKLSILFILTASLIVLSFSGNERKSYFGLNGSRDIVLQFNTYNGYGNNLYLDNVRTGERTANDITVTSVINIPYDTVYSVYSSGTDTVSPLISVSNIGTSNSSDTVRVYLRIEPGNYFKDTSISALSAGQTAFVRFSTFEYSIGTPYFITSYVSDAFDSNYTNDTLKEYAISLPGFRRNVLFEEFSSNASPACANNNSFINQFTNTNIQTVNAIVYHTGILGNDTFYTYNPVQNDARKRYYFIAGVPITFVDGIHTASIPYGDSTNLYKPYLRRYDLGTPVSLSVSDENLGDSIRSTINVNVISHLIAGDYRLRVNAIERYKTGILPTLNGETEFYDIFRKMYPDTNGFIIDLSPGNYSYTYTYYKDPEWVDSMLYTTVFIQDDQDREIINSAKSREIVINGSRPEPVMAYSYKADLFSLNCGDCNYFLPVTGSDSLNSALNVELFEGVFPPLNWKLYNRDGFLTFEQFTGANGPTISGLRSAYINFFNYNIIGQKDSLRTKVFQNLYSTDSVKFDYAYAQYNSTNIDSLIVTISTDGGITFPTEIFRKGGLALATAPQTSSGFIPQNNSQWRVYSFPLNNIVSVNNYSDVIPSGFRLDQNYPNPFNPETKINFELPVSGIVSLKIYDITGREIYTLLNRFTAAGKHSFTFNPKEKGFDLSSGVYFYRLITNGFSDTKRMVLIK
ncbi:MAG: T9SS type A sorting domain-containing protein [Bacteroidetes bacterium]|nr:T9SS type A sorting domain-containing protein [Bacteroidota bacterium]